MRTSLVTSKRFLGARPCLGPHDPFVGGDQYGARGVGRLDARLGNHDLPVTVMLPVVESEPQVGRGEDARLRHVRDQQPFARQRELALQAALAPSEPAVDAERAFASLACGIERQGSSARRTAPRSSRRRRLAW